MLGGWDVDWARRENWRSLPPASDAGEVGAASHEAAAGSWVMTRSGQPWAGITLYDYCPFTRRGWLAVVAPFGSAVRSGPFAVGMFLEGVFRAGLLDRVWIDVDEERARALRSAGFVEAGVLQACHFNGGRWEGRLVMSCGPSEWEAGARRWVTRRFGDLEVFVNDLPVTGPMETQRG